MVVELLGEEEFVEERLNGVGIEDLKAEPGVIAAAAGVGEDIADAADAAHEFLQELGDEGVAGVEFGKEVGEGVGAEGADGGVVVGGMLFGPVGEGLALVDGRRNAGSPKHLGRDCGAE